MAAASVASLDWMLTSAFEKDPRLSFLARVQHVVQSGCELQHRSRRYQAVLWRDLVSVQRPGLLRQDGVCLARLHDLHQHVQRGTVHAEGDRERRGLLCVALQLSLFDAPAAHTRSDALAGGLVDDHDSDPLHVGVLLLSDVELFHALGGRLVAHAHATQELLDPSRACTDVESRVPLRRAIRAPGS